MSDQPEYEVREIETRDRLYDGLGSTHFHLITTYKVKVEPLYKSAEDAEAKQPSAWRIVKMYEVTREIR